MPRPPKPRRVGYFPRYTVFQPVDGSPEEPEIHLAIDELEAIRLKDLQGFDQGNCARLMNVAQSTFQRILTEARIKIAQAVVEGRILRIQGGCYVPVGASWICDECSYRWELPVSGFPPGCPRCKSSRVQAFDQRYGQLGRGKRRGWRGGRNG